MCDSRFAISDFRRMDNYGFGFWMGEGRNMEITGKILFVNPAITGETKNGSCKKQEFVIETNSQYPKRLAFHYGEKELINLPIM